MPKFSMGSSKPRVVDLRGGRHVPPIKPEEVRPHVPRRSELKLRKQRTRAVLGMLVAVCTLLSAYAIHLASYMERFTFQKVAAQGVDSETTAEVQKFAENVLAESSRGFISERNIFTYDFESLGQKILQELPQIKSARVTRDSRLGNGVAISLIARAPFAKWCTDDLATCYTMDDTGVVYAPLAREANSLITQYTFLGDLSTSSASHEVAPYGQSYAPGHVFGIGSLLTGLTDLGLHPQGAKLVGQSDFYVPLEEGYYLKASFGEEASALIKNLSLILNSDAIHGKESDLEYIDLRFGNRVYYKFKNVANQAQ